MNSEAKWFKFYGVTPHTLDYPDISLYKMVENADNGKEYNGKCFITHSDCYEDARAVADLVEEYFPNLKGKVVINYIGSTIGAHTGPGTVALFFFGNERNN